MRSQAFFSKIWCYLMGWGRVGTQLGLTCNRVSQVKKQQQKPRCNPYLQCPFGVQRLKPYDEAEGRVWWDGLDGWDGSSKVSFKNLHTLLVYRSGIYLLIHVIKNCHQDSYRFQNLMSSWGWGKTIFEITLYTWVFKNLVINLSFFLSRI